MYFPPPVYQDELPGEISCHPISFVEVLILRPEIRSVFTQGKVHISIFGYQYILFKADGLLK